MAVDAPRRGQSAPAFLPLAADPLRWQLLIALAPGDRRVRELSALVGKPESLVSYHLGKLRAGGCSSAVAPRTGATRTTPRARSLRRAAGRSGRRCIPALRRAADAAQVASSIGSAREAGAVPLHGNSARSQMAEALLETLPAARSRRAAPAAIRNRSPRRGAGDRERGIDIAGRRSKHVSEFADESFDYVDQPLRSRARGLPGVPRQPRMPHWSIPDPAREVDRDAEMYPPSSAPPTSSPPHPLPAPLIATPHRPRR